MSMRQIAWHAAVLRGARQIISRKRLFVCLFIFKLYLSACFVYKSPNGAVNPAENSFLTTAKFIYILPELISFQTFF